LAFEPLSLGDKKPFALGQKVQVLLIHSHFLCAPSPSSPVSLYVTRQHPLSFLLSVYLKRVTLSKSLFLLVLQFTGIATGCWFSVWIFEIIIIGCA